MNPIIPAIRKEPFDDPAWLFELTYDGFRGIADTIGGRMLSKNQNRLRRFDPLLDRLPPGCIFDGEIVALDETGRPIFNDLLFGRREPTYIAFDLSAGKMYWVDTAYNLPVPGDIRVANLDGSAAKVLLPNLNTPEGIALDRGGSGLVDLDVEDQQRDRHCEDPVAERLDAPFAHGARLRPYP